MPSDQSSDFHKRLDDVIREELSVLGYSYAKVVVAIEESRGESEAVIRLHPPYEDLVVPQPEQDITDSAFAARIRRLLKVRLEAPERPAAPPESY